MNERDRVEMEARALRWGDLFYGPIRVCTKTLDQLATETALRWKQLVNRDADRP
jgi:hypothetical protein